MKNYRAIAVFLALLSQPIVCMEPHFRQRKQERREAQLRPYRYKDFENIAHSVATLLVGGTLLSIGCVYQNEFPIGIGLALLIGGADEIVEYDKYQRSIVRKKALLAKK